MAYIAVSIGEALELQSQELLELYCAASVHDIGAVKTVEKKCLLNVNVRLQNNHSCYKGYHLLKNVPHFENISKIILHHQDCWSERKETYSFDLLSDLIHVADLMVSTLTNTHILHQHSEIMDKLNDAFGTVLRPDLKDVINEIGTRQSFWLDLMSPYIDKLTLEKLDKDSFEVNFTFEALRSLIQVYSKIIDMKCNFTYRHSHLVTNSVVQLGMLAGLSSDKVRRLELSGLMHDLGKISIPESILRKSGPLTSDEFKIIQQHAYHTYHIIKNIPEFSDIARWAAFHHERLDGKGYPFRVGRADLDIGCRIVAVADIFSALIEDRPYRSGLDRGQIEATFIKIVKDNAVDAEIVHLLFENYDLFEYVKEFTEVLSNYES
ncbi:HD-GYP domain-containing protein (c-di-GMP phosphodiesterase class II) [Heliophilum fasciatum]|nr:HD-GYP domain-containing protein (c-di-GMP phosphodiesterase class II) [Heliophilum fasciatum]